MFSFSIMSTQSFHFKNLFDVDPTPSDIVAILMDEVLGDVGNKEVSACNLFIFTSHWNSP